MCNCSGNSCGCATIAGRRGQRGPIGLTGPAGANAQILSGDGVPTTDPTPVTAYAQYADLLTGGNWWIWTPGSGWADTGVQVSGADGADGDNAWTLAVGVAPIIPVADGASFVVTVLNTAWMGVGQLLHITDVTNVDLGYYEVSNVISPTQVLLTNPRNAGTGAYINNANGSTLNINSKISPGGIQGPVGADGLAATVTAGTTTTLAAGNPATVTPVGTLTAQIFDFGIPTGATGAAGHSPVVTTVTSNPTGAGGAAGDIRIYQPVSNSGYVTFYYNLAGVWTAGPTVLSSRLIGYSMVSATPNPGGVPANVSDYYWSYVAGRLIFSVCSVAGSPGTWVTAIDILMTGGSGAPVDAEYITASANATLSNERVANSTATIVPDTTVAGQMRWNVPDDGITNAKLNNVPSNTFKGLGLGGPANPIDMTADQASTVLDTATDPFVRTSAIPGGTVSLQSASNGSPVLGDGRETGTNVWTMQRSIQYVPNVQASAGVGTTTVFQTDSYQQHELNLSHESVSLAIDPPTYDTSNFLFSIINTTAAELTFQYSAATWSANTGVTVPYTVLGGARVVLVAHYVDGVMVITEVIQNTTPL